MLSLSNLNLDRRKRYTFGRIATGLYLISLFGLGFIGFSYQIFPEYLTPVLLITIFGLAGIFFAVLSGGMKVEIRDIQPVLLTTAISGVVLVAVIQVFTSFFTDYVVPQGQTSLLTSIPLWTSVLFFLFVAIQEEAFYNGIYIYFRTVFKQVPAIYHIIIIAIMGTAFHQAVGKTLYGGTIFSAPEFYIWIFLSWILYRVLLEVSGGNVGISLVSHGLWNVAVVLLNSGAVTG